MMKAQLQINSTGSSANVSGEIRRFLIDSDYYKIWHRVDFRSSGMWVQIKVEADKSADVHLVLKGATMTNTNAAMSRHGPCLLDLAEGTTNKSLLTQV